jgi:hypothetical protein
MQVQVQVLVVELLKEYLLWTLPRSYRHCQCCCPLHQQNCCCCCCPSLVLQSYWLWLELQNSAWFPHLLQPIRCSLARQSCQDIVECRHTVVLTRCTRRPDIAKLWHRLCPV